MRTGYSCAGSRKVRGHGVTDTNGCGYETSPPPNLLITIQDNFFSLKVVKCSKFVGQLPQELHLTK